MSSRGVGLATFSVLVHDRRVSSSLIAFCVAFVPLLLLVGWLGSPLLTLAVLLTSAAATALSCRTAFLAYAAQAWLLGSVCGLAVYGWLLADFSLGLVMFCRYVTVLSVFHFTEFMVTSLSNIEDLKVDSFLLNHSLEYWLAAVVSWLEFGLERLFLPQLCVNAVSLLGLTLCVSGELVRKSAMWHARKGFTHLIAVRKHREHTLVTDGVYGLCRHPGYLGWFMWSVGTQLTLCNPFCVVAYALVTFRFFEDRIYQEEQYLVDFFGQRYLDYQKRVPTGIPGISGYTPAHPSSR